MQTYLWSTSCRWNSNFSSHLMQWYGFGSWYFFIWVIILDFVLNFAVQWVHLKCLNKFSFSTGWTLVCDMICFPKSTVEGKFLWQISHCLEFASSCIFNSLSMSIFSNLRETFLWAQFFYTLESDMISCVNCSNDWRDQGAKNFLLIQKKSIIMITCDNPTSMSHESLAWADQSQDEILLSKSSKHGT